jgi:phosphonate transport system ATP-binding protein
MPSSQVCCIEVRDLRVVFPNGHEALKSISVEVAAGEFICIIGRSGAGKSTLLRCINGLVKPTSGSVVVDGTDVMRASAGDRRRLQQRVGFIFQEFNLVERLSVMKNVLAGRLGHRDPITSTLHWFGRTDREIALRSLERVNLAHKANQRADSLSGGEKQRVAIARALTQEPVAVLADEPVASLDPELAWSVMADLKRTAIETGIVTLVNIHDVNLARTFADRIVGVAGGEVVFDGAPSTLDETALRRVYQGGQAAFVVGDQRHYANRDGGPSDGTAIGTLNADLVPAADAVALDS